MNLSYNRLAMIYELKHELQPRFQDPDRIEAALPINRFLGDPLDLIIDEAIR